MRISNLKFFLLIIFLNNFLISQEISFIQSCKITDQIIFETNEGKPKRYSGYTDDLEVGDYFDITFIFDFSISLYSINVTTNTDMDISLDKGDFASSTDLGVYILDRFATAFLGPNEITLEDQGRLGMYRYYKDDWNLHFRRGKVNQSQMIVADCQSLSKKYDQVLEKFYRIHGYN